MAKTFVDDTYNYFDNVIDIASVKKNIKASNLGLGETRPNSSFGNILANLNPFGHKKQKGSRFFLGAFRELLLKLKDLKNQLTLVKNRNEVDSINAQISQIQLQLSDFEKKFIGSFADKQGAKTVINSVTSNPDLSIDDNVVAQNFFAQAVNQSPNVVTPVPIVSGGYEEPLPVQQEPQQGTEVVDKTIQPKKDNTLLYVGLGLVAVLLLTRK